MDLSDYRKEINEIDSQITELFERRMRIAEGIAQYKKECGIPVLDREREAEKLKAAAAVLPQDLKESGKELFECIMRLSRGHQEAFLSGPAAGSESSDAAGGAVRAEECGEL